MIVEIQQILISELRRRRQNVIVKRSSAGNDHNNVYCICMCKVRLHSNMVVYIIVLTACDLSWAVYVALWSI